MTLLAQYTTLGLGGPARTLITAASDDAVIDAVRVADTAADPVLILGGGSNLVIADDGFPGTAVHVDTRGISYARGTARAGIVEVTVAAGENWDDVVAATIAEGLAGLECLSGIPGRAGATPIQNVGAYGQEVADAITSVRALDRRTGEITLLTSADCQFSYRDSMFKRASGRYLVLAVTLALPDEKLSRPVRYAELAATLGVETGDRVPCADAREAVLAIRGRKGMVVSPDDPDSRSAGSFFTNPVVDAAQIARVEAIAEGRGLGAVPRFDAGDGHFKLPAAWLIERSGFAKGYGTPGGARVSAKHTLALVNGGAATTQTLLALAREIVAGVRQAFGVTLEPEPILVGVAL
ncbi:MAG TPA: UDP-N-acetylmuramate dehydrogenase [Trebonia sp.]|jgi:UDP-N-acetylmuramate dehydrogenase|nr:UDP-N-acetylmuramate dehydrogenase [Trebonia sp.]